MTDWLPTVTAVLLSAAALGATISRANTHNVEHIDRQVRHLERFIVTTTQDAINAVTDQLRRAKGEIVAKLVDAQAQIDAAGVTEQIDLSALNDIAQSLDDIVPNAPEVTDDGLPGEVVGDDIADDEA